MEERPSGRGGRGKSQRGSRGVKVLVSEGRRGGRGPSSRGDAEGGEEPSPEELERRRAAAEANAAKQRAAAAAARARRAAELAARDPRLVGGVQPSLEQRTAEASGVKRSFARAEALPPGEWERLKAESLQAPVIIKIGRRGATPEVAAAAANAWRKREVVKLRVHDDRSARKAILTRYNLVLRELEETTGGVLLDVRGSSIWLYRGPDWTPPPEPKPKFVEPATLLQPGGAPTGAWRIIAGLRCYEAGSRASGPPVVLLPDAFSLEQDTPAMLQVVDRIAASGLWVVVPELLTGEDAWPRQRFPPEGPWKNTFAAWLRKGPGAWASQRDKVAALAAAVVAEAEGGRAGGGGGGGVVATRLGVAGIGWGALMALWAGTAGALAPEAPQPAVIVALAPLLGGQEMALAAALESPAVMLPGKYDGMDKLQVHLSTRKEVYGASVFKRFGFCLSGALSYAPVFLDYDPKPQTADARKALKAVAAATEMVDTAAAHLRERLAGGGGGDGGGSEAGTAPADLSESAQPQGQPIGAAAA